MPSAPNGAQPTPSCETDDRSRRDEWRAWLRSGRVAAGSNPSFAVGTPSVTAFGSRTVTPACSSRSFSIAPTSMVLQAVPDAFVEARERRVADRRGDAQRIDHLQRQPAILLRELHHEARREVADQRPLGHRDRELVVPGHRRAQHAQHQVEREPRLRRRRRAPRVDAAPNACASRLFRSFIVCPAPSSPQWKKSVPMQSSSGRQRAITSAGPPTISVSVPATAASAVLPTGLSIISAPFARDPRADAARGLRIDRAHVDVDRTRPDARDDAVGAERDALDVRRIRQHRDDEVDRAAATSRGVAAERAPAAVNAATACGTTSHTTSSCPLARRLRAIGAPIVPNPMKPAIMTLSISRWTNRARARARERARVERHA